MKKVFLAAVSVALLVLLLAVASGVALASSQTSTPSVSSQGQPAVELQATESPVNVVEEVVTNAGDDGPEGGHDDGACGCEGGCAGHVEGGMWSVKIDAAAEFLGLTSEEIAAQVEAGKRLYEIAEEQGADVEAFREAVHGAVAAAGGCGCGSH